MGNDPPNVWETLEEALRLYWQAARECWPSLLAVFVPLQLVVAVYRHAAEAGGATGLSGQRELLFVMAALGMTVVPVAVAIVLARAFFKCTGRDLPSGGVATWGRMMATAWLRTIVEAFLAVVTLAVVSKALGLGSSAQPSTANALVGLVAFAAVIPLVLLCIWIFVRWSFAVVLSALRPVAGAAAFGASSDFVRGKAGSCILLFLASFAVAAGISAVPDTLAAWYARGEALGLPAPSGTALTRTVALFVGGLCSNFAGLFVPVAMMTYWVRAAEPRETTEDPRRGRARRWVSLLMSLGVASYAAAWYFEARAMSLARAEEARSQPAATDRDDAKRDDGGAGGNARREPPPSRSAVDRMSPESSPRYRRRHRQDIRRPGGN